MKLLRQMIRRILLESFDSYDKLTKDEQIELRMMEHSKAHINLENNVAIAKAFRYYSETTSMPLYRGVYNTETRILESLQVGDTFQLGRVTSLSESFKIAKRFAKLGNMIELASGTEGCFSLVGLIVNDLNQWEAKDPRDFKEQDGDWRRDAALREAEWLMPADATYKLLDISERDGVTVYKIESAG